MIPQIIIIIMKSLEKTHQRYLQQASWTQDLRHYILQSIDKQNRSRILEIGSGTGAIIGQMGDSQQRFAVDIDFDSLNFSNDENKDIPHINGDGILLPIASHSIDVTYSHYLFLWVEQIESLLSEMERVTRPGGWVIAFAEPDYGGRVNFPESLGELGILQAQVLEDLGADIHMGRKLAHYFNRTGLEQIQFGVMGFQKEGAGINFVEGEQKMLFEDLKQKIPKERLMALMEKEKMAIQQGSRINFVPTFYAYGQKK